MSIIRRPATERGREKISWLDSRHTFSFANYYDPAHMGFRNLRVINDDRVSPDAGFATHGHRDMEIISYVVEGALAHEDTTGGKGVIRRGDVQAMSAGTGVRHSEYNASESDPVRFLQIWILPSRAGLPAKYRQAHFSDESKLNQLRLLVASEEAAAGNEGALGINQDLRLYGSILEPGVPLSHPLAAGRGAWVQVVNGDITVNGQKLESGDGAAIEDVAELKIEAAAKSEFLLFDLA
ncbi:MAG TPA: pirin family protein [Dongiaceae bacterium]|nr:pirin family protein [Dongiaceae bacterium]